MSRGEFRVLLLVSEPVVARVFAHLFKVRWAAEVRVVESLDEATRALDEVCPHLMLLDATVLRKSGMKARTLSERLRARDPGLDPLRAFVDAACARRGGRLLPIIESLDGCEEDEPTHMKRALGVRAVLPKPFDRAMLDRAVEAAMAPVEATPIDLSRWHALRSDFRIACHTPLPNFVALTSYAAEAPEVEFSDTAADCAYITHYLQRLPLPLYCLRGDALTARRHALRGTPFAAWLRASGQAVDLPDVLVDPDALAYAFPMLFAPSDAAGSAGSAYAWRSVLNGSAVARGAAPSPSAQWPIVRDANGNATEWAELVVTFRREPWGPFAVDRGRDYGRATLEMLIALLQGATWSVVRDEHEGEIHIALPTAATWALRARLDPRVEEHRVASLLCDEIERVQSAAGAIVEHARAVRPEGEGVETAARRDALLGALCASVEWLVVLAWINPSLTHLFDAGISLGDLMGRFTDLFRDRPSDIAARRALRDDNGHNVELIDPSAPVRGDERFGVALDATFRWLAYALAADDGTFHCALTCALGADASSREAIVVTAYQPPGVTPRVRGDDAWRAAADEVTFAGGEFERQLDPDGATRVRFSLPLRST